MLIPAQSIESVKKGVYIANRLAVKPMSANANPILNSAASELMCSSFRIIHVASMIIIVHPYNSNT